MMADQHATPPAVLQGWLLLLLDTVALSAPQPASRLAALLARIEDEPALRWNTDSMARCAGVSRLHALFHEELDTSHHAWLQQKWLDQASAWLATAARRRRLRWRPVLPTRAR